MRAVERLDEQHVLIAPAVLYVAHQDDVMPDPAFGALPGVLRGWETALRAVLALADKREADQDEVLRRIGRPQGPALLTVNEVRAAITAAMDGAS